MAYLATIAAFGFPDFNPPTLFPIYKRLGCRACQFYRNPENPPDLTDARKVVEDTGLYFDSLHGLFGPDQDPSSPDEAFRKQTVDLYRQEGDLALQLGGPMVVVHPAPLIKTNENVTDAQRTERAENLQRSLEELAKIGERSGVTYLIENIPENYYFGSHPAQLADMIRQLDHPKIRMCFDTGHAHMTADAPEALGVCADVIAYSHIHDNDAVSDSHQVPGDGSIPWDRLQTQFSKLPKNTPAMLELFLSEEDLNTRLREGLGERLDRYLCLDTTT